MLELFKTSIEMNKASYISSRNQQIQLCLSQLETCDQDLQLLLRQRDSMRQGRFNWSQDSDVNQNNLNRINLFLLNFYQAFNLDTDKQFGLTQFFQKIFPLDFLFLYFKHQNFQFGHFIYDGSLRIKSTLIFCFIEFYLNTDFHFAFRIEFGQGFDFDSSLRNKIRSWNRQDLLRHYEKPGFSLRQFIHYLLDNYYPKVGWRWIGANHLIYYNILILVANLFELGFWSIQDLDELLQRLY